MKSVMNLKKPPKYKAPFLHPEHTDVTCVLIEEGPYADIVFYINTLSLGEDSGVGDVPIQFTYEVVEVPDSISPEALEQKELLEDTIAMILFDLLEKTVLDNAVAKE